MSLDREHQRPLDQLSKSPVVLVHEGVPHGNASIQPSSALERRESRCSSSSQKNTLIAPTKEGSTDPSSILRDESMREEVILLQKLQKQVPHEIDPTSGGITPSMSISIYIDQILHSDLDHELYAVEFVVGSWRSQGSKTRSNNTTTTTKTTNNTTNIRTTRTNSNNLRTTTHINDTITNSHHTTRTTPTTRTTSKPSVARDRCKMLLALGV